MLVVHLVKGDAVLTILIIDDEPAIRVTLSALLRAQGHLTASVESAELALPMLPYVDACLCDGLDGAWRAVEPACRWAGKRFVLYSGDEDTLEEAMSAGVMFVRKPALIEALLAALEAGEEAVA